MRLTRGLRVVEELVNIMPNIRINVTDEEFALLQIAADNEGDCANPSQLMTKNARKLAKAVKKTLEPTGDGYTSVTAPWGLIYYATSRELSDRGIFPKDTWVRLAEEDPEKPGNVIPVDSYEHEGATVDLRAELAWKQEYMRQPIQVSQIPSEWQRKRSLERDGAGDPRFYTLIQVTRSENGLVMDEFGRLWTVEPDLGEDNQVEGAYAYVYSMVRPRDYERTLRELFSSGTWAEALAAYNKK